MDSEAAFRECMTAYQAGDGSAVERLYALFSPELRRFFSTNRATGPAVDDLVQETFLKIHSARRSFDPARPFRPWAFAIARHVFLMQQRADTRRVRREADVVRQTAGTNGGPSLDLRRLVCQALGCLTEEGRQVIRMRYLAGLEFDEIASALGIRSGTLRVRASRALESMRRSLHTGNV